MFVVLGVYPRLIPPVWNDIIILGGVAFGPYTVVTSMVHSWFRAVAQSGNCHVESAHLGV